MSTEVERDGENAIRVFTLSGTPYERGFQHGQQIGDMLADYWESAVRGLAGTGPSDQRARTPCIHS